MPSQYAYLKGKMVVECSVSEWANSFQRHRKVALTKIGEAQVSTVFLGLNHQFLGGPPLWFETMVFGGKHDQYQARYTTWEQAEKGHRRIVNMVRGKE